MTPVQGLIVRNRTSLIVVSGVVVRDTIATRRMVGTSTRVVDYGKGVVTTTTLLAAAIKEIDTKLTKS